MSTVRIRLTTDRCPGPGVIQREGDVIEVDPETATRMLRSRQAEAVTEDHPAREAMVRTPDRRAVSRQTRQPRGAAACSKG